MDVHSTSNNSPKRQWEIDTRIAAKVENKPTVIKEEIVQLQKTIT